MPGTAAIFAATCIVIVALVIKNLQLQYQASTMNTQLLSIRTDLQVCSARSELAVFHESTTIPDEDQSGIKSPEPTLTTEHIVQATSAYGSDSSSHSSKSSFYTREESIRLHQSQDKDDSRTQSSCIDSRNPKPVSSSVWCHEANNRVCQLENVCYIPDLKEFVLFIDDSSLIINAYLEYGTLTIDTSSVVNHNARQVMISSLPSESFGNFIVNWHEDTSLLFGPFLPDNTMHLFHDDLLPLHHTLQIIDSHRGIYKQNKFQTNLFIYQNDNFTLDDNVVELYEAFIDTEIQYIKDLHWHGHMTCFRQLYIGLSVSTVWYDYGFEYHQKPVLQPILNAGMIRQTTSHLVKQLDISPKSTLASDFIVIFSRKRTRKILNEAELIFQIVKTTGMRVVKLNLEYYSLNEIISYVLVARGIISVHGSLLILSMFLKPGSFVIELFPYAVNPDMYTPYKTLCQIPRMNIVYRSWTNQIKENSIGHSDWPAELGGLAHLEESQREVILAETEVKPHRCCKDPSWLYHINQDTNVDPDGVVNLVVDVVSESQRKMIDAVGSLKYMLRPSQITGVTCRSSCHEQNSKIGCNLNINWDIPWNIGYIPYTTLHYQVLIQDQRSKELTEVIEKTCTENKLSSQVIVKGEAHLPEIFVWVKGILDNKYDGPFSKAVICSNNNV